MNNNSLAHLDQEELFQIGVNASAKGDSATAIACLKEAVSRPDATAKAHYLLGAEYAQIQLMPRAIDEMEAALALDPALSAARLQLGMLWLTTSQTDRAAEVLRPLEGLGEQDAMHHFGSGLLRLIADDAAGASAALRKGIELNSVNAPLNKDMEMIVTNLAGQAEAAKEEGEQVFLGAYAGNSTH